MGTVYGFAVAAAGTAGSIGLAAPVAIPVGIGMSSAGSSKASSLISEGSEALGAVKSSLTQLKVILSDAQLGTDSVPLSQAHWKLNYEMGMEIPSGKFPRGHQQDQ